MFTDPVCAVSTIFAAYSKSTRLVSTSENAFLHFTEAQVSSSYCCLLCVLCTDLTYEEIQT